VVAQELDLPNDKVKWLRNACEMGNCSSKNSSASWIVSVFSILLRMDLAVVAMDLPLK
jgi:hypothetical protein